MKRLVLALAAVLLLAGCFGEDKKPSPSASSLVDSAITEIAAGHQETAEALLRQALKKEPDNALAHYNLGVIFQSRGDNQAALDEYGKALVANPKYVPALFNTATIYGNSNPALAITTYKRVIALQPLAPTAYLNLGLLEIGSGLESQGIADLTAALRQDPSLVKQLTPAIKKKVSDANDLPPGTPTPTATP
jgi:Tfp pilus assembly protein PilF